MSACEHCGGQGRIEVGEYGGDCAAIHGMGGRMPDPPGLEHCDACAGTGSAECIEVSPMRSPFSGWCAVLASDTDAQAMAWGPTRDSAAAKCAETAVGAGLIEFEAAQALPVREVTC